MSVKSSDLHEVLADAVAKESSKLLDSISKAYLDFTATEPVQDWLMSKSRLTGSDCPVHAFPKDFMLLQNLIRAIDHQEITANTKLTIEGAVDMKDGLIATRKISISVTATSDIST